MVSKTIGALHLGSSTLPLGVGNVDRFFMHSGVDPCALVLFLSQFKNKQRSYFMERAKCIAVVRPE
jgi:hypothetical protein